MVLDRVTTKAALALVWLLGGACSAYSQTNCNEQALNAAVQDVKKAQADMAKMDRNSPAYAAMFSDKLLDVHTSGWMYDKTESLAVGKNLSQMAGKTKVIKSERAEEKTIAVNCDTVIETSMNMTYYEVPNPQDLARAAGTNTFDPAAMEKAAHSQVPRGPGEAPSLNPFRTRSVRVWARINGHWQIAATVGTTVRERTVPGRL